MWLDIPPVRHASTKRREANELSTKLLQRVLEISTEPGDLVLDPFGGSGTTYAVAEQMKRRWFGVEIGDTDPIVRRLKGEPTNIMPKNLGDSGKGLKAQRRSQRNGSADSSSVGTLWDSGDIETLPIMFDGDNSQEASDRHR